ncbi:MAG: hypothetical protein ACM31P_10485 [Actinomycetota bacterium]
MNVREALNHGFGFGIGQEQTISGYLTVCKKFSYLSADEKSSNACNSPSVLITDDSLSDRLLDAGASMLVGTMVMFCGSATVSGIVSASGLPPFPIAFNHLIAVEFESEGKPIQLSFGPDR